MKKQDMSLDNILFSNAFAWQNQKTPKISLFGSGIGSGLMSLYDVKKSKKAWFKNFRRKEKRGKFNSVKAVKGLVKYYVPKVLDGYLGRKGEYTKVKKRTRYALAGRILRQYRKLRAKGKIR